MSKDKLYSVEDFIYWVRKNNDDVLYDEKFTQGQIANIVGKAMLSFFEESETPY